MVHDVCEFACRGQRNLIHKVEDLVLDQVEGRLQQCVETSFVVCRRWSVGER